MAEKKLPKILRKKYTPEKFRKKIVQKLYLPQDRDFLTSSFIENESGIMEVVNDLDYKAKKRLSVLAKQIKKNKGILRMGRLSIPLAVLCGAVIFNILFLNTLVSKAFQDGLEQLFQARAEVEGLRLNIIRGTIEIDSLSVADARNPMFNLFNAENAVLDIHVRSLLERKLAVIDMSVAAVDFGRARNSTGALPASEITDYESIPLVSEPKGSGSGLLEIPSFGNDDINQYISDYLSELESFQQIQLAEAEFAEVFAKWNSEAETIAALVSELESTAREAATLRPQDFRTVEDIETARNLLTQLQTQLSRAEQFGSDIIESGQSDLIATTELISSISNSLSADIGLARQDFEAVVGDPAGIASEAASVLLTETAWQHIERIQQAFVFIERLKGLQSRTGSEVGESEGPSRRGGIDVEFPSMQYPGFYIGRGASSFRFNDVDTFIELLHLNSSPELIQQPTSISYRQNTAEVNFELQANLPLHEPDSNPLDLRVVYAGFPVQISRNLESIGHITVSGSADLVWMTDLKDAGNMRNSIQLNIPEPNISIMSGNQRVDILLNDIIRSIDQLDVSMSSVISDSSVSALRISTNLDDLLTGSLENLLRSEWEQFQNMAEDELRKRVDEQLSRLNEYRDRLDGLSERYQEYENRLAEYRSVINDFQNELIGPYDNWETALSDIEKQISQRVDEQLSAAEDEARQRAAEAEEKARREAEELAARLEAERETAEKAARAEAERVQREAEAEARRRAEEEADRVRESLPARPRLPGF